MKILLVSQMVPFLPCHDGFRVIPANVLRVVAGRHDVHLLAVSDGTEEPAQRAWAGSYCRTVEVLRPRPARPLRDRLSRLVRPVRPELVRAVREAARRWRPDLVQLEGPALAPLARVMRLGAPVVLSGHDALSLRYEDFGRFARSGRARLAWRFRTAAARRFERRWYRWIDHVIITSPADRDALARWMPAERVTVVSNGVDLDHWAYRPAPDPDRIVFTGNMSWPPNEDAARHFALDVYPRIRARRPSAEFWVVGATPSLAVRALGGLAGVHVTGTVPDLREFVWRAAVYVSPLRFGAGVKNKILEAMALGAPIVATPRSLTGTPLVPGRHLLLADGPDAIAEAVLTLLDNGELRQALSKEARRKVELEYSWESAASRFEAVWRAAVAGQPGSAPGGRP